MRPNPVKQKLQAGGVALGTFVFEFATTGVGRLAAGAGAEFVLYDLEHTGWSLETLRMLFATTGPTGAVPLTRVPAGDYHFVARALDVGAMGVMAPMVESAEQARRFVAAAKYPPEGRRGAAFGVAHDDYAAGDFVASMAAANRDVLTIALVETAAGVAAVDEIAQVDGLDVLWIGHYDLTNSLGIPGQFTHPRFTEAVDRILAACRQHGKVPGMLAGDVAAGTALLDAGFRMVAYGGDLWLYQQALRQGIDALRTHGR